MTEEREEAPVPVAHRAMKEGTPVHRSCCGHKMTSAVERRRTVSLGVSSAALVKKDGQADMAGPFKRIVS